MQVSVFGASELYIHCMYIYIHTQIRTGLQVTGLIVFFSPKMPCKPSPYQTFLKGCEYAAILCINRQRLTMSRHMRR